MSQPAPVPPDAGVAKQLGYARLLYDQAVTQTFTAPSLRDTGLLRPAPPMMWTNTDRPLAEAVSATKVAGEHS